jgi:hypothetical protein
MATKLTGLLVSNIINDWALSFRNFVMLMITYIGELLKRLIIRFLVLNITSMFFFIKNSSHSTAFISKRVFLIYFQFCTQFLHILMIQFQKSNRCDLLRFFTCHLWNMREVLSTKTKIF